MSKVTSDVEVIVDSFSATTDSFLFTRTCYLNFLGVGWRSKVMRLSCAAFEVPLAFGIFAVGLHVAQNLDGAGQNKSSYINIMKKI